MIVKGSRYVADVGVREDEVINIARPVEFEMGNYMVITTKEGESFESLAARYLQNSFLYWKIADCNQQIKYPDYLEPGTRVRIPLP